MATSRQLIISAIMGRLEGYAWQTVAPADFVLGAADSAKVNFPVVQLMPGQESVVRQGYGSDRQMSLAFTASVYVSLDQMTKAADEIMEYAFEELKTCLFATPLTVTEDGAVFYLSLMYEQGSVGYDYETGPGFAEASVAFTVNPNIYFP